MFSSDSGNIGGVLLEAVIGLLLVVPWRVGT